METPNIMVTHSQYIQHQDREIKTLKEAYSKQNQMIEALKTAQHEQGQALNNMNTIQQDLVTKINLLVQIAQGNNQKAENRTAAGNDHAWLHK